MGRSRATPDEPDEGSSDEAEWYAAGRPADQQQHRRGLDRRDRHRHLHRRLSRVRPRRDRNYGLAEDDVVCHDHDPHSIPLSIRAYGDGFRPRPVRLGGRGSGCSPAVRSPRDRHRSFHDQGFAGTPSLVRPNRNFVWVTQGKRVGECGPCWGAAKLLVDRVFLPRATRAGYGAGANPLSTGFPESPECFRPPKKSLVSAQTRGRRAGLGMSEERAGYRACGASNRVTGGVDAGMTAGRPMPTQDDVLGYFNTLSNWGRWGDDDELGTLNHITDDVRVAAAWSPRPCPGP